MTEFCGYGHRAHRDGCQGCTDRKSASIDYKDLLRRYIEEVVKQEGDDFVGAGFEDSMCFTAKEVMELRSLAGRNPDGTIDTTPVERF